MSVTRVMVVDDFFSRTLISETLRFGACEVVGEAGAALTDFNMVLFFLGVSIMVA